MLSNRQKLILKAIVETYIETSQPVGSKALTEKPYLDFSSATIRYDMADLEEQGYIEKTHTSSGRVPSEKGYRYYVENLVTRDVDVMKAFPLIDEIFAERNIVKEQAISEAILLLSELTKYAAVALGPNVERSRIKRVEFVPVSPGEGVLLIVTNHGHVQNQLIKVPQEVESEDLRRVLFALDDMLRNRLVSEAQIILQREFAQVQLKTFIEHQDVILNAFVSAFQHFASDNFYMSGMSNVFYQPEFHDVPTMRKFLDAMDRRELIRLFANEPEGLRVTIGKANTVVPMENCTIISIPYAVSDDEFGTIAVIGPTRMEYKRVIPLLEYIAQNMSKLYKK